MAMNKVPTLVLGIGGIGCRMAANVADLLSEEDRQFVGVVGLDTNVNDLRQLKKRGMRTIQTSDERTVRDFMKEHFFSTSWFPLDRFTAGKSLLNGAGQIRAVSRLAAIAAEEQGKFLPIKEEIQRIRRDNGQLTVMVLGSITGGTGAGLFLQLPYYLRKVMHEASGRRDVVIRGMFVGPDMTADVQPSAINRAAVHVNGYACLKELNAIYLRENGFPGIAELKVDFFDAPSKEEIASARKELMDVMAANGVNKEDMAVLAQDAEILAAGNPALPYDYVYLIENSNSEGTIGEADLTNVEELVGRMAYTLMFSPVRENALSVEDNMVLQDMATRGMNRYSSAGICRLVYPMEIAREYVTLATVRNMVREEWLALDERYKTSVAAVRDEQRSNPNAKLPAMSERFVTDFENLVLRGESALGKLSTEAFLEDSQGEKVNRAEQFMTWLKERVREVTNSSDVKAAASSCCFKAGDMLDAAKANLTVVQKKNALIKYEELAKKAIGEYASVANTLFPATWSMLSESKRSPETQKNIYSLLYNVHPITARYFCYKLIGMLDKEVVSREGKLRAIDLTQYAKSEEKKDYDKGAKDIQSVGVAIENVEKVPYFPVISAYIKQGKLEHIEKLFKAGVKKQMDSITAYMEHSLYIQTCKLLKTRLELLVENYQLFFESIAEKIRFNDARIAHLEDVKLPLGQLGVYCTKEAFEQIAAEFNNQNDGEMQTDTKTAIFEALYHVFDKDYSSRGKTLTEKQKEQLIKRKHATLASVFESAVVSTVRTSVLKNGQGTIDITVRQALEKEYDLLMPDMTMERYVQSRVEFAMEKAAPMLTVDTNAMADNTQTIYLALHPECADVQIATDGITAAPSSSATAQMLIPNISDATNNLKPTVLINESFSPYDITCFKARYKFAIEDLVKYKDGSVAERCYRERIAQLGTTPAITGNPDDGLRVVPPHLDRYWHEEAYLPPLSKAKQRESEEQLRQAFIYGLGTDFFLRKVDDKILDTKTGDPMLGWYYATLSGLETPLKVKGTPVGTAYADLYRALPYMGRLKRMIMEIKANESLALGKQYPSMEEREYHLLENEFIRDLMQDTGVTDDIDAESNIFDIFLEMRSTMAADEWAKLFDALLQVLQDYCKELYAYDTAGAAALPIINRSVRKILDEIFRNSRAGRKAEGNRDFGEKDLFVHFERIHRENLNA